jgi:hypothetical protein
MKFKYKLVVAFSIMAVFIGTVLVIQWMFLNQPANTETGNYNLNETFSAESFLYGPQTWIPYAEKLAVMPGVDINGNSVFNVMFVDLNATSNLNATFPSVRVDYRFEGLHGTAAFHVYGYIQTNQACSWTNRVEGQGASGFYVTAPASQTTTGPNVQQPIRDFNHVYIKVSNQKGASFNDYGNDTYLMKFEKVGGGVNTLHITTDPRNPTGEVTTTDELAGKFYVDFTGDRVQNNFILLVAVNGTLAEDFKLNLRSSVSG